jgi:exopolysaccharide biosynthesis protein
MNVLLTEKPIGYQKIAVHLLIAIFATVIFLGEGLCFWGKTESAVIKPDNLYGNDLQIQNVNSYKTSVKEVKMKLWEISLARRYGKAYRRTIKDGVVHIKITKTINGKPIKINVIEINQSINPKINIAPIIANKQLNKKSTVVGMSKQNKAFAAINGSYFKPETGVPLGILMIDKKILTGPIFNRVALGITESGFKMARVELNAKLLYLGEELKINNINQPRTLSTDVLLYTPEWGKISPPTPKYGIQIAIKDGTIINKSINKVTIPENGYVISGPKSQIEKFLTQNAMKQKLIKTVTNPKITLDIKTNPDWEDVNHIIGGGPYLVKNGNVYVDYIEERFKPIVGKNPRTAVGYTKEGNFIMLTIDGREETSVGVSLFDLAKIMKSFECVNAMNLDGGGSSTMQINGNIVNTPSIKGGIAVSNSLALIERFDINNDVIASAD